MNICKQPNHYVNISRVFSFRPQLSLINDSLHGPKYKFYFWFKDMKYSFNTKLHSFSTSKTKNYLHKLSLLHGKILFFCILYFNLASMYRQKCVNWPIIPVITKFIIKCYLTDKLYLYFIPKSLKFTNKSENDSILPFLVLF